MVPLVDVRTCKQRAGLAGQGFQGFMVLWFYGLGLAGQRFGVLGFRAGRPRV